MSRVVLVNGQQAEEIRVALVDDGRLEEYQVEVAAAGQRRGNIYRGVVVRVEASLNAAFVDIGVERHGFLAVTDVVPQAWHAQPDGDGRPRIDQVLQRGRSLVVQVTRDAEGTKGPTLTTSVSIAGRYLVLTPFDQTRGLSRKVEDDKLRKKVKKRTEDLAVPDGCGFIIRTNAADQNKTELKRDLALLLRLWGRVDVAHRAGRGPRLLYNDQDLVVRTLRDYLDASVTEVLFDDERLLRKARDYVQAVMPRSKVRLEHHRRPIPLFSYFNIEPQIDEVFSRSVRLPSGGAIVIDTTEALVAVDVNSGKATGASSQAETALQTNLEAAGALARQLRLRDLGGLIVVDFIDMRAHKDQRKLEKVLREAMKPDRARLSIGRVSANGLVEINRQRIHQAIQQRTHRTCPTCGGVGRVASTERVGLGLLRRIQARAATGRLAAVRASLHPELAEAIQNGRRAQIARMEQEYRLRIEVVGDSRLSPAEERIEWTRRAGSDARQDPGQHDPGRRDRDRPRDGAEPVSSAEVFEELALEAGAALEVEAGAALEVEAGAAFEVEAGTALEVEAGAALEAHALEDELVAGDEHGGDDKLSAAAEDISSTVAEDVSSRRRRRRGRRGKRPDADPRDAARVDLASRADQAGDGGSGGETDQAMALVDRDRDRSRRRRSRRSSRSTSVAGQGPERDEGPVSSGEVEAEPAGSPAREADASATGDPVGSTRNSRRRRGRRGKRREQTPSIPNPGPRGVAAPADEAGSVASRPAGAAPLDSKEHG